MEFPDQEETLRKKIKILFKSLYGYTDENNPFGDPNLTKPFTWHKKNQRYLSMGLDPSSINDEKTLLLKLKNAKTEIEYLNKLRIDRENSKALKTNQIPLNTDWKEKDDSFLLNQEQLRTEIRIKQGREKPIDFLIKSLKIFKGEFEIPRNFFSVSTYQQPYEIFDLLSSDSLTELYKDIKFHSEIDKEDFLYWQSMITLCESRLIQEKKDLYSKKEIVDIVSQYKTLEQLREFENELNDNVKDEYKSEEVQFWKNVIDIVKIEKTKIIIDNMYREFEEKYNVQLKKIKELNMNEDNMLEVNEGGNLSPPLYESDEELRKLSITEHDYLFRMSENRKKFLSIKLNQWQKKYIEESNAQKRQTINEKEQNSDDEVTNFLIKISGKTKGSSKANTSTKVANYSKEILSPKTSNANLSLITKFQLPNDVSNIKESRFDLQEEITQNSKDLIEEISMVESEELGDNENIFNEIVPISVSYEWASKYKPIKPRYSNRIRIGYEWNKYNQAHYDFDNPPPKIIQGYKFNIFYPYLIDKTKTPEYTLERADVSDMCIIRFHAGAPYEDIAFKIANREWDMTERAGFKNLFDKGILRLYFKFKRYRYKR